MSPIRTCLLCISAQVATVVRAFLVIRIDGSGLVSDNLLSSFVILVQPPKSCHMQIRHDIIADRQLIVVTSTSLQLEFLNTKTEIVHGDGVIVVPNVDVKE